MEDVVPPKICDTILELAPEAVIPGDGNGGRARPFTADEVVAGITPVAAAQWAVNQPEEGGRRAKAIAWAQALLKAFNHLKRAAEVRVGDHGNELFVDFAQLVCREHTDPEDGAVAADSFPPHADNCYRSGNQCIKDSPFYYWRSVSAHLFLSSPEDSDFEGGDFFFTPHWDSAKQDRAHVRPRKGRMVAFSAGVENLHGVTKVTRGRRCGVSVWLTPDENRAATMEDFNIAEDILAQVPVPRSFKTFRDLAEDRYQQQCAAGAVRTRALEATARKSHDVGGPIPLQHQGRTILANVVTDAPGPQITQLENFLSHEEIVHLLAGAMTKFASSTVYEGGKLVVASYRSSKTGWLPDDDSDVILTRILDRIKAVTGLTLASAEHMQVAHYDSSVQAKYSPHIDWGTVGRVTKDYTNKDHPGARIATLLIYLSGGEEGGCTAFPNINVTVAPKPGMAVFWYNLRPSGAGDELVRHGGCPTLRGSKFIATKWIHDVGNEAYMNAADGLPRIWRDWPRVAQRLSALEGGGGPMPAEPLVVRRPCEERRAAGECSLWPVSMYRACPGKCGEDLIESPEIGRFVREGVVPAAECASVRALAERSAKPGDGYRSKGIVTPEASSDNKFAGVTPLKAVEWAEALPDGPEREKALAGVKALLQAAETMKRVTKEAHGIPDLWYDFIHLTCRWQPPGVNASGKSSHADHADNCWESQSRLGECHRSAPAYHHRSHSSVLFLGGDYDGGEFYYTPEWRSASRVLVPTEAGRMVTFRAGAENIHGVTQVSRGTRCALLAWFTEDRSRASLEDETANVLKHLAQETLTV